MTTTSPHLVAATKLHNHAVALIRGGLQREALPLLTDAFAMGIAASGRALFALLGADRDSRERAAHVAARAALMDPMHFQFVDDALRFNAEFATESRIPYERVFTRNPRPWSIVVCSHEDEKFEYLVKNLRRVANNFLIELIRISDARSMNDGYQRGVRMAKYDHVLLCHHDIDFLVPDFFERLSEHMVTSDLVGIAGASSMSGPALLFDGHPHLLGRVVQPDESDESGLCLYSPSPFAGVRRAAVLDGVLIAARRDALMRLGFDQSFSGFHFYDIDLTYRASIMGYKVVVAPDLAICHQSLGVYDQTWRDAQHHFAKKWPKLRGLPGRASHHYVTELKPNSVSSVWSWLNRMATAYDQSAFGPQN